MRLALPQGYNSEHVEMRFADELNVSIQWARACCGESHTYMPGLVPDLVPGPSYPIREGQCSVSGFCVAGQDLTGLERA